MILYSLIDQFLICLAELKEFFYLFRDMCEPYYKTRISIKDAHTRFKVLLNKYSKSKKVNTKKKKNKKKTK